MSKQQKCSTCTNTHGERSNMTIQMTVRLTDVHKHSNESNSKLYMQVVLKIKNQLIYWLVNLIWQWRVNAGNLKWALLYKLMMRINIYTLNVTSDNFLRNNRKEEEHFQNYIFVILSVIIHNEMKRLTLAKHARPKQIIFSRWTAYRAGNYEDCTSKYFSQYSKILSILIYFHPNTNHLNPSFTGICSLFFETSC